LMGAGLEGGVVEELQKEFLRLDFTSWRLPHDGGLS
jgi:hypothetical protein